MWIDVEGQSSHQQVATNHEIQVPLCVDEVIREALVPEECTELVPVQSQLDVKPMQKSIVDVVHSTTESAHNYYSLQIIMLDRNVLDDTQCDFASRVCDSKTLCRIPLIN